MDPSSHTSTAYSPARLQRQLAARPRSGLKRLTGRRLPWGNTQPLVPDIFMTPSPDALRMVEQQKLEKEEKQAKGTYKPAPLEHIDFHDRCDHEHYRHAPWAARAQFWIYLAAFGKGIFLLLLAVGGGVSLLDGVTAREGFFIVFLESFTILWLYFLFPSLFCLGTRVPCHTQVSTSLDQGR